MNYQNSQQLTIQQAISRAKKAVKQGKIADAVEIVRRQTNGTDEHLI